MNNEHVLEGITSVRGKHREFSAAPTAERVVLCLGPRLAESQDSKSHKSSLTLVMEPLNFLV